MDLLQKIRTLPTEPGVYLYKNAAGEIIYVGKAKSLRNRVASYFHEGRWQDAKTGTLVRVPVFVLAPAGGRSARCYARLDVSLGRTDVVVPLVPFALVDPFVPVVLADETGAAGTLVLELAMTELAYTGLSTWLESAPPGPRTLLT